MVTIQTSRARTLFLLALVVTAGCGDDGPSGPPSQVIVPEAWRGMWQITYTASTCTSDSVIDTSVDIRPACPGQTLEQFLGIDSQNVELSCSGEFTDTALQAHCTGQTDLVCLITLSTDLSALRADSLFSGTAVLRTTLDCGGDQETDCETYAIEGVRIDPSPAECDAPVALAPPLLEALTRLRARGEASLSR